MIKSVSIIALLFVCSCDRTFIVDSGILQREIENHFPVQRDIFTASIKLKEPKIELLDGTGKLRIKISSVFVMKGFKQVLTRDLTLLLSGTLSYNPQTCTFYMSEPSVDAIEFDQLPVQFQTLLDGIISTTGISFSEKIDIYTVTGARRRRIGSRMVLQDVTVSGGDLRVTMKRGPSRKHGKAVSH